jgi:hypothetical protein
MRKISGFSISFRAITLITVRGVEIVIRAIGLNNEDEASRNNNEAVLEGGKYSRVGIPGF